MSSVFQDRTYIPDDNFEQAIIDLGFDDVLDDYVLTSNINEVGGLGLISKNISDLTKQSIFKYAVNSYKCIFKPNFFTFIVRSAFIRNWNFIKYIFFLR